MGVVGEGGGFFSDEPEGMMVTPGQYTVALSQELDGQMTQLTEAETFNVKPLRTGALKGAAYAEVAAFWQKLSSVQHDAAVSNKQLSEALKRTELMAKALKNSLAEHGELDQMLNDIVAQVHSLDQQMNGNRAKQEIGEKTKVTIGSRIGAATLGTALSTYGPTATHRQTLAIASEELAELKPKIEQLLSKEIPAFESKLAEVGAPYIH